MTAHLHISQIPLDTLTYIRADERYRYALPGPRVIECTGVDRDRLHDSGDGERSARISTPVVRK